MRLYWPYLLNIWLMVHISTSGLGLEGRAGVWHFQSLLFAPCFFFPTCPLLFSVSTFQYWVNSTAELAIFNLKQNVSMVHSCKNMNSLLLLDYSSIGKTDFHGERRIVLLDISPPIFANLINVVMKNTYFLMRLCRKWEEFLRPVPGFSDISMDNIPL